MSNVKIISDSAWNLVLWLKYLVLTPSMFKWKQVGRVHELVGMFTGWV